jgi:prepilin-type N-terminal cleavage/methylation domain-containing protein
MSMKKQSGFTLIELLLVLAIIGIISAIAIPALLNQRARARDKSAIENMTGSFSDLIGQYDKAREAGQSATSIVTTLQNYIKANLASGTKAANRNPWAASQPAYASTVGSITATTMSKALSGMTAASLGKVYYYIKVPTTATSGVGFFGGAVKVQNSVNGSTIVRKVAAIE